jgi:hypothetical protein
LDTKFSSEVPGPDQLSSTLNSFVKYSVAKFVCVINGLKPRRRIARGASKVVFAFLNSYFVIISQEVYLQWLYRVWKDFLLHFPSVSAVCCQRIYRNTNCYKSRANSRN